MLTLHVPSFNDFLNKTLESNMKWPCAVNAAIASVVVKGQVFASIQNWAHGSETLPQALTDEQQGFLPMACSQESLNQCQSITYWWTNVSSCVYSYTTFGTDTDEQCLISVVLKPPTNSHTSPSDQSQAVGTQSPKSGQKDAMLKQKSLLDGIWKSRVTVTNRFWSSWVTQD